MSIPYDDTEPGENVQDGAHGGPWPAFVDLFSATAMIMLVFFAVIASQYVRLERETGEVRTRIRELRARLDTIARADSARTGRRSFTVRPRGPDLLLILEEDVSFPRNRSGFDDLKAPARVLLDSIARLVRSPRFSSEIFEIQVVGHADTTTFDPASGLSNWGISAARAAAVARFLVERAGATLDPCRVVPSGRGDFYPRDPAGPGRDSAQLAQDRRIEILLRPAMPNDTTRADAACRMKRPGSPA